MLPKPIASAIHGDIGRRALTRKEPAKMPGARRGPNIRIAPTDKPEGGQIGEMLKLTVANSSPNFASTKYSPPTSTLAAKGDINGGFTPDAEVGGGDDGGGAGTRM
ncbi:hypothetical protein LBMAG56_00650 [Verrucomicrobiota bacterium]|nr:hypothetical protein LBMAG56_00650 [Verrucomicrobiota bacterium]